ncbi:NADH dehydrogenase [ubiquinone] 1 alpha subcomplex subunit 8-B-like [Cannabis sativa]|uniref:NADH dehydrogenase [ubiquinone] 1 alpha subcomplex subunit 8-B-like n=1 Tax=Cannabis sativa TaxID=3483 RepID=UPI0029CA7419|nr:NADH dehydrogenase [ubiquinone] 1 alpha subcomplex subunit 8-B-like [Cannabis sativa]
MPWLVHDTNDDLSSSRVRKMLHENYLYRGSEFGNVDAAGDTIPTSAVLMASSKQIAFKCQAENVAFLKCKKNDPNTEKCLDKGQQVTRCVLGL